MLVNRNLDSEVNYSSFLFCSTYRPIYTVVRERWSSGPLLRKFIVRKQSWTP